MKNFLYSLLLLLVLVGTTGCGTKDNGTTIDPGTSTQLPTTPDVPTTNPDAATTVGDVSIAFGGGSSSATLIADGVDNRLVRVTVLNGNSLAFVGQTVTFFTTAGTFSDGSVPKNSAVTDTSGFAELFFVAPANLGSATIRATIAGVASNNITATFVPGPVSDISLSAAPTFVRPGGDSTLDVRVTDAHGYPIALETISFDVAVKGTGFPSITPAFIQTDANGQASAIFTSGLTNGTDTISAKSTNGTSKTVDIVADTAAVVVSNLSLAGGTVVTADGGSTLGITATMTVSGGLPENIPVAFSFVGPALGCTLSPATVNTNSAGEAVVNLVAGTATGSVTVSATASGFSRNLVIALIPGSSDRLTLTANPSSVFVSSAQGNNSADIFAEVIDSHGNAVPGEIVDFNIYVAGNKTGAMISPASATTNSIGIAHAVYSAGVTSGTDTITAATSNGKSATVDIAATHSVADIVISLVNPGAVLAMGDTASFTVTAVDSAGAPVVGAILSSVVTGSATLGSATLTTNPLGQATFAVTDATPENVILRIATVSGAVSVERALSFGATLNFVKSAVQGVDTTNLNAYLRDANGNGISGVIVGFTPVYTDNDNVILSNSAVTDSLGAVSLTVTDPSGNGGDVTVTAIIAGTTVNDTAVVTFTPSITSFALTAAATMTVADPGTTSTVMATLTDLSTGLPATGYLVDFAVGGSASPSTSSDTTDATGRASVTVTDGSAFGENSNVSVTFGNQTVMVPIYFGASLNLTPTNSETVADGQAVRTLTATVADVNNVRLSGIPVSFNASAGTALLDIASANTDSLGEVQVNVTDSVTETVTVASASGSLTPVTADIVFIAGDSANLSLSSAPVNTTALSLFGQATITATVADLLGNNVADNTPVTFAISGTASVATVTPLATTVNGKATASLSAGNVSGSLTVTATAGSVTHDLNFTVAPSDAGSIQVVSVNPEFVQHLGQSGAQTSIITFAVKDPGGNNVADGTDVTISLDGTRPHGGELLSDGLHPYTDVPVVVKTVAGSASVTFLSGIVSGTVDVIATVSTSLTAVDISTVALVTVVSGQGDSLHQFTSGSPLNIPSLLYDGCTADYNFTLGDRYGNPVPDGTNVSFMVEPGCTLIGSSAGFPTTTEFGRISIADFSFAGGGYELLPVSHEPYCTVVAYTLGDEGFADVNGNGVFDAGDTCYGDQAEPFVDANDDDTYTNGELYIDTNGNGSHDDIDGSCSTNTTIWKSFKYLTSGSIDRFDIDDPSFFSLNHGASKTFVASVEAQNGAPPIGGTTLTVTSSGGTLYGDAVTIMPDTTTVGAMTKTFGIASSAVTSDPPELVTITVDLKAPGGGVCQDNGGDFSLSYAGLINVPAPVVPAPVDVTPPTVTYTVPANGAINVGPSSATSPAVLAVIFNEAINPLTANAATIQLSGDGGTTGTPGFYDISVTTVDNVIFISPISGGVTDFPFITGEVVTVNLTNQIRDMSDNPITAPLSFSFTVFNPYHLP